MAVISLNYCNAAIGDEIQLSYNDVTHVVSLTGVLSGCSSATALLAGEEIYSHVDGGSTWKVLAQNSTPYAYVVEIPTETCTVTIDSINIGNASTSESADGTIEIIASGLGTKSYSIDDGQTWQSSNQFTGLAAQTYAVKVRSVLNGNTCFDSDSAVVGFNALVCDLELGTINTTSNSITVVSVNTTKRFAVEYRLDAGAWQDSPVFTSLASATYNVQVRFKDYTSCSDSRNVTVSVTPCDIMLQAVEVTHETAQFAEDGTITIFAQSAQDIEYSIDDGANYQSSNYFEGVAPDEYVIRIRNTVAGCEASQTVTVKRYKRSFVEFSQANAHRVVLQTGPVADGLKQNMDNTLFGAMRYFGVDAACYYQKWPDSKESKIQFRSSYEAHTAKLYTDAGVLETTLTPVKRSAYLNQQDSRTANFSDAGGSEVQVWFPEGLPSFYQIGQRIEVTGLSAVNGSYQVKDIRPGVLEAEGNIVLIIDKVYTPGTDPVTATVALTYDVELFDVWELTLDWLTHGAGKWYVIIEGTDTQLTTFTARTEPIEILSDVSELVELKYRNYDNAFKIDYSTGIEFLLYVEGEVLPDKPGGEREQMDDSRRKPILLREYVTRNVRLEVEGVPPYLGEKIKLALAHDLKLVNGVQVEKAEDADVDYPDAYYAFCDVVCRLRQSDFMTENVHDAGDVDSTILEIGDGNVMQLEP